MIEKDKYTDALLRDGTSQAQRLPFALDPEYVSIDERELEEFLEIIYTLSDEIDYYDETNTVDGNWQVFFESISTEGKRKEIVKNWGKNQSLKPHIALLLSFLKLFGFAQKDINTLTRKHLDFFYKKILGIKLKEAVPDQVHVIFELAKNISQHKISQGTRLKAGKDDNGNELYYETIREAIINKAKIEELKSVFVDKENNDRFYATPVANSSDGFGGEFEDEIQSWHAFGESQQGKSDDERTMIDVTVGFAVSSPLLWLKEGERKIILDFELIEGGIPLTNQNLDNAFEIYLSGEKEWIGAESITAKMDVTSGKRLTLSVSLPLETDPIVPYDKNVLDGNFDTQWPVLKLLLKQENAVYKKFRGVQVSYMTLTVSADRVKDLVIQNEQGVQPPDKPFSPFGTNPAVGSVFYVGSEEVFLKKLDTLGIYLTWDGLPDDDEGFKDYYDGYSQAYTNSIFKAKVGFLDKKKWLPETPDATDDFQLFDSEGTKLKTTEFYRSMSHYDVEHTRKPSTEALEKYDNSVQRGFIRFVLDTPDFGHREYTSLYTSKIIEKVKAADPSTVTLPNPPYTPVIKSLALKYSSSETIYFNSSGQYEKFFHIEPFGQAEQVLGGSVYLFPQYESEGNFYIGLEDFDPPQNINLLFQVAEGSADPGVSVESKDISWSYLSENKWIQLDDLDVISDTTVGLQTSGIIELTIGREATDENTLMPSGLHWLKAEIGDKSEGVNQVIEVKPQAVTAQFVIDKSLSSDMADHFSQPLAANSISKLATKDASIKSVSQPYTSFDGKTNEKDTTYYARVSERLRHKKRAVTIWDYEHMVLEEFPNIYKVKCLNHTSEDSEIAPGNVTLIAIENIQNKNAVNPLEPKTSTITLTKIKEYLESYISPFINLSVENPTYEKLLVHFSVGFYTGKDPGYYGNLLNEEIKKFLSPWAYEEGKDIVFGGKVYKSDILAFVESRDYVDYVNDFKLYHIHGGGMFGGIGDMAIGVDFIIRALNPPGIDEMSIGDTFVVGEDTEVAAATSPRSILVSASTHYVKVLESGEYLCAGVEFGGIGSMSVGIDFIVS